MFNVYTIYVHNGRRQLLLNDLLLSKVSSSSVLLLLAVVVYIHCMLLIRSDAGRCLCVRYRILLRLPLFLINKCTEAVILADIACSSPSHVTGLAGHLVAGQGKFVQSSGAVWCMGAQWARSLVILILSVSLALTGSHTQISCNHGQPVGPTDLYRISFILFCEPPSHFSY